MAIDRLVLWLGVLGESGGSKVFGLVVVHVVVDVVVDVVVVDVVERFVFV